MRLRQRLPASVHAAIQADLRKAMAADGLDALIIDHWLDVSYVTGFVHFPNERPAAVWMTQDTCLLLVPALEADHAAAQASAAELVIYPEYPGVVRPMTVFAQRIGAFTGRVAHPGSMASGRVADLRTLFPDATFTMADPVGRMRLIKRPEEIALHREAARLSDGMIDAGLTLIRDALTRNAALPSEAEITAHVVDHAIARMYLEHDDVVVVPMLAGGLVYAGKNSAFPHGLPSAYRPRAGDTFILSLGCAVGGRYAESERTFVLGAPSAEQRRYHDVCRQAQEVGTEALTAGRACRDANRICLDVIRNAGMAEYLRHRQGHGIGLGFHEPPWIEDGDDTLLEPGMIVSSEPGIYVPGHAGYRISDTVLITADGPERLTTHPRTLDACVVA
jgi:Xaa-Pro aminopeptidase